MIVPPGAALAPEVEGEGRPFPVAVLHESLAATGQETTSAPAAPGPPSALQVTWLTTSWLTTSWLLTGWLTAWLTTTLNI
jgi:hypothetical protein